MNSFQRAVQFSTPSSTASIAYRIHTRCYTSIPTTSMLRCAVASNNNLYQNHAQRNYTSLISTYKTSKSSPFIANRTLFLSNNSVGLFSTSNSTTSASTTASADTIVSAKLNNDKIVPNNNDSTDNPLTTKEKFMKIKSEITIEIKWLVGGFKQIAKDVYALYKIQTRIARSEKGALATYENAAEHRFVERAVSNLKLCGPIAVLYVLPVLGNAVFYLLLFKPLTIPAVLLSPTRRYHCIELRNRDYRSDFLKVLAHPESEFNLLPSAALRNALVYVNDLAITNQLRNGEQLVKRFEQWCNSIAVEDHGFRNEGLDSVTTSELIDACDKRGLMNILLTDNMNTYAHMLAKASEIPEDVAAQEALEQVIRKQLVKAIEAWLAGASKLTNPSITSYLNLCEDVNSKLAK